MSLVYSYINSRICCRVEKRQFFPKLLIVAAVAFLAIELIAFAPLFASNKYDILVNDDNSSTDQLSPRVATGNLGNFLIVWADKRNGQNDIYGQFYDTAGRALGYNIKINDDDVDIPQFEPSAAGNNSGQFVTAWKDYRNGAYPFRPDIYFSRADSSQSYTDLNITIEPPDSTKESPDIALFPNGYSIAVWSDYRNHNWDIYGQKLNANGGLIGKNFKVNSDAGAFQQHSPRVAAFFDGGFVVVWYDNRNGNDDIFGQIYNSLGNPVGANRKLSDDAGSGRQAFPAVAIDGNKRISVAWADWRNGVYPQNPDIYFRRFDSTGSPLIQSVKINSDGGNNPQREVSICSDWLGNIALVWSDSSGGQWDAMSQIIDHSGVFIGGNFRIHQNQVGRQLQPDVDADGYKLFFVWTDSRSGNFDIYATIYQYNQPGLLATPNSLNFSMDVGGALPSSQQISIRNAGIGALPWSASTPAGWLSLAPSFGITPDAMAVSVTDGSLPYGEYYASIRVVNSETHDSSTAVPVKLTVTAPLLDIVPDSLFFKVFAVLGNPPPQSFQINNIGSGSLTWTAVENASWFSIDKLSGNASDFISVSVDIANLTYGHYSEALIINSLEAVNSPETTKVHLELIGNMPYLSANPDSVVIEGKQGSALNGTVQIINLGEGALNWKASARDNWISVQNSTGSDNDILNFNLETSSLAIGSHFSEIIVSDTASFNQSINIPVELSLLPADTIITPAQPDTVSFGQDTVIAGGAAIIPLTVYLTGSRKGGYIPFFCNANASLDSIVVHHLAAPSYVDLFVSNIQNGIGELGFRVADYCFGDSAIPAGEYHLADLFLKAGMSSGNASVDTTYSDSSSAYILDELLEKNTPVVRLGKLIIESPPPSPPQIPDTVRFLNANVATGGIGILPFSIRLTGERKGGYVPFSFDTSFARLDSIVVNEEIFPGFMDYYTPIHSDGKAEFGFRVSNMFFDDSTIRRGNYEIATLFFTAGLKTGIMTINVTPSDSSGAYTLHTVQDKDAPIVFGGTLTINQITSVIQTETNTAFSEKISLGQNLPNPFNSSTEMEISIPRAAPVTVEIFNLLGQEICRLYDGILPAGVSRLRWSAVMDDTRPAPGGVYFYKLKAGETVLIKKMVLLK